MGIRQLTNIIESAVCLALLIPLLLSLLPTVRLDEFRQNMFSVRNELFDYAAAGHISYNDPAYRLLRQLMNGYIRYGHQLTFFRVFLTVIQSKTMGRANDLTWTTRWEKALANIKDEKVRSSLSSFHDRTAILVATRLVFGSPVLIIFLLCAIFTMMVHKGLRSLNQILNEATSSAVSQIVDARLLEEEALKAAAA
jgi:hypothetical protein